jgi:acetamidase/formamidase
MEHQIDPSRIHHSWDNRLEPTLRVRTGDVVHCDILMAGQLPELGTLPDRSPDPYLRTFDLRNGAHVDFAPGVRVPFAPFLGTMEPTRTSRPPHPRFRRTGAPATSTGAT